MDLARKTLLVILFGGIMVVTWIHLIRKKPGNEEEWRDCVWKSLVSVLLWVMAIMFILSTQKVVIYL